VAAVGDPATVRGGRTAHGRWAALTARPTLAAALLYAVLSLALYAPALLPGMTLSASDYLYTAAPWSAERPPDVKAFGSNFELVDSVVQFQPYLRYSRERLPGAPLWNPYIGIGRPFVANAQSAVLSPFSIPSYVLGFWWSLGLAAALKVFVAAFGTYLLGRALGMRFGGALLAGIVFAFSLFFVVWVSWPHASVWAFLPWLLLLTDRVLRRPAPLSAAGLAAVVALQFFGGHPESNFHVLVVTVLFFPLRLVTLRRDGEAVAAGHATAWFAAALAGGTALAAITLLPFLELLSETNDVDVRADYWKIHMPREYLLGLALPDYWGRGTEVPIGAFAQGRAVYVGALPLLLAGVALVTRRSLLRFGVAVLGVVMLAIVVGVPVLPDVIGHVPIVRTGNHVRLEIVVVLCLALLAGWGLDDLCERRLPSRRVVLALGGALLVLPVLVLAARGQLTATGLVRSVKAAWDLDGPLPIPPDDTTRRVIHMSSLVAWVILMGAGLVLVAARVRSRLPVATFVALAVALTVVDLFRAGMGQTPAIDADHADQPPTPALRLLQAQRLDRFVGLERPLGPSPVTPNIAMRERLYDARSYDVPVEEHYDRLWRRAIKNGGPTDFPTASAVLTPASLPALRLLSVTHVVQDPGDPPVRQPRLPVVYDRDDARIYAIPRALPRAGVVGAQQTVASDDAELDAVLRPDFDGRRTLVTREALPGLAATPAAAPAGRATIVRYEPERVVVDATVRRPSALVLTDLQYPGWKATVDGRPADLRRVDWLLRATPLPAGRHRVELRYEPASWRAGWIVSLIALVALAATVAIGLRARRRPAAGSP
jgi:hypothetical protein